jgi:protein-S-isoprenylcysteine O-methyltransferase Ste14
MGNVFELLIVWAGGGVFVASLAYCAYSYVFPWSEPFRQAPFSGAGLGGGWAALVFDAALLSVFAIHHSVFARDGVKTWLSRVIPERLLRSFYVWIASLLLIAVCALWQPLGTDIYHTADGWKIVHTLIQVLGLGLIAASVRSIDPLELAGIRRSSLAGALQTTGPYRIVRHPLYFGWSLAVFGAAHMTGDRLAFATITVAYLIAAIPLEERSLTAFFGPAYDNYRRHVRWRMFPYVY